MNAKEILTCKKNLLRFAKRRAKAKGREFSLTLEDLDIPEYCPVLGIKLEAGGDSKNSPSIDRLDRTKGYTKDNILVISYIANVVRHQATPDEIIQVGKFFKYFPKTKETKKNKVLRELYKEQEKVLKLKLCLVEAIDSLCTVEEAEILKAKISEF